MDMRICAIASPKTRTRTVADVAYATLNQKGLRLSISQQTFVEPNLTSQPKRTSFAQVDIQAELKKRPWLRNVGGLPMPTKEMATSFSKEMGEARFAAPSCSPY